MTVKIFKMINGEVIMADIVSEDFGQGHYVVNEPASVMLQERDGGMGVGIAPYMPYAEGKVKIRLNAIAAEADISESVTALAGFCITPLITLTMPEPPTEGNVV
jgi:hypothetical protein